MMFATGPNDTCYLCEKRHYNEKHIRLMPYGGPDNEGEWVALCPGCSIVHKHWDWYDD